MTAGSEAPLEPLQPRLEQAGALAEYTPPPADGDRPKAAVWTVTEPEGPWCQPGHVRVLEALLGAKDAALLMAGAAQHSRASGIAADGWHLRGATRRGRRHAHVGAWNDDALAIDSRNGRHVLVVADGAGSAPLSRLGSALAVHVVRDALYAAGALSAEQLVSAVERAVSVVREFADSTDVEPRAVRTTLAVAAWDAHTSALFTAHVGDGALALVYAGDDTAPLRVVQLVNGHAGEWSGEVHCFIPDSEAPAAARAATVAHARDGLLAVLLTTDGIDDAIYPLHRHVPDMLAQWMHGVPEGAPAIAGLTHQPPSAPITGHDGQQALLTWLGFEKRGENDDRTVAVAWHDALVSRVQRTAAPRG